MAAPERPSESIGSLHTLLAALASAPDWARAAPAYLDAGDRIGRYEISREIGRGGFGIVFEAEDGELHRKVALKVTRLPRRDEATLARVQQEAQAAARLNHPNIVTLYDWGSVEGLPYLVLELLEGETLAAHVKRGPIPPGEALRILRDVARALVHAHGLGLVHLDLKPSNVFLTADARVKVLDFGLAEVFAVPDAPVGALGGTPGYMPPEQSAGAPVDARADVFSLGVTAFVMLTGELPESGEAISKSSLDALPVPFRDIISRAIEPDRERRWPSAAAMLGRIEAALAALDPRPRSRLAAIAILVAAVVSIGAAGFTLPARSAANERVTACKSAGDQIATAWDTKRSEALHRAFVASGSGIAESSFRATAKALDEASADWARARIDACAATRVRAEQSEATLERRVACFDESLGQVRAIVDVLEHADPALVARAPEAARSLEPVARCSAIALASDRGEPHDAAAIALAKDLEPKLAKVEAFGDLERSSPETWALAREVADTAERAGLRLLHQRATLEMATLEAIDLHPARASELAERAADEAQAIGRDDLAVLSLAFLGRIEGRRRRYEEGHRAFRTAHAILEHIGQNLDREAGLLGAEGAMLVEEGKAAEGVAVLRRAAELYERTSKRGRKEHLDILGALGRALSVSGNNVEAIDVLSPVCARAEELLGPESVTLAMSLGLLGSAQHNAEQHDAALTTFRRALAIYERYDAGSWDVMEMTYFVGDTLVSLGRGDEATPLLERVIAAEERSTAPPESSYAPLALNDLAGMRLSAGDAKGALDLIDRAIAHPGAQYLDDEIGRLWLTKAEILWTWPRKRAQAIDLARASVTKMEGDASELASDLSEARAWLASHSK